MLKIALKREKVLKILFLKGRFFGIESAPVNYILRFLMYQFIDLQHYYCYYREETHRCCELDLGKLVKRTGKNINYYYYHLRPSLKCDEFCA